MTKHIAKRTHKNRVCKALAYEAKLSWFNLKILPYPELMKEYNEFKALNRKLRHLQLELRKCVQSSKNKV